MHSGKAYPNENGRGWGKPLAILAVVLAVAALAVTYFAGETVSKAEQQGAYEGELQGYEDGRQDGGEAGTAAGYEAGYQEGDETGYADGTVKGSEEGAEDGYAEGYPEGHANGTEKGYTLGLATGQEAGERDGRTIGAEDGYEDGYADGFEEGTSTGYLVRNPTYSEALEMLEESDAYTAEEITIEFEAQGIRTGYAWAIFAEGGGMGVAFVAFDTVDNGVIVVDPWSREEIVPEVGKRVSELLGYSAPDFDDTIARLRIAW